MRRRRRKKILIVIIVLLLLAIIGVIVFSFIKGRKNTITEGKYFEKHKDYMVDLTVFASNMDDVYTLYFTGAISDEDFANQVKMLDSELKIFEAKYNQDAKKQKIKVGSSEYVTKKGIESVRNIMKAFEDIITVTFKEDGSLTSSAELSYLYLSYKNIITQNIGAYDACVIFYGNGIHVNSEDEKVDLDKYIKKNKIKQSRKDF